MRIIGSWREDYYRCLKSIYVFDPSLEEYVSILIELGIFYDFVKKKGRITKEEREQHFKLIRKRVSKGRRKKMYRIYDELLTAVRKCVEYANRYEKCRQLEQNNAPPDDIEICYEVADKTRPPIQIIMGG